MAFGGRSSPLNPVSGPLRLTTEKPVEADGSDRVRLRVEKMACTGEPPAARWRHAAAVVSHSGERHTHIGGPEVQEPSSAVTLGALPPCREKLPLCFWRKE